VREIKDKFKVGTFYSVYVIGWYEVKKSVTRLAFVVGRVSFLETFYQQRRSKSSRGVATVSDFAFFSLAEIS